MIKEKVTSESLLVMYKRLEERLKEREGKIAAYKESFRKCQRIFFYGAGTDAKVIAGLLRDVLRGKEVCFIDKNKQKHGMEVVPGIFCRGVEDMYGYGKEAIIIITSSRYADEIEYELMGGKYQTEGRLLGTPICAEFCLLLARNMEIEHTIRQKDKALTYFDVVDNEKDRRRVYYNLHDCWRGLSFREYNPDEPIPPEEENFSDFLAEFLGNNMPQKKGNFILCSSFSKDKIRHLEQAGKGLYDKLYAFELNRLYMSHYLTNQVGSRTEIINACLGEISFQLGKEKRGNGVCIYDWLDCCSDEFVEVKSVDEMLDKNEIEGRVSLVRLCIGNGTGPALRGMKKMLMRDKPLIIMQPGGHWSMPEETFYSLVTYIHNLVPEYKVFVKEHLLETLDGGWNAYFYV